MPFLHCFFLLIHSLSSLSFPLPSSLLSSHHTSFFHLQLQFPSSPSPTLVSESDTRISVRMRNPSSVKRELLRKWIKGLSKCRSLKNNMSFLERKKAIKLSADLAMASTRSGTTRWSRALIAEAFSRDDDGYNKILTEHIVGSPTNHQRQKKGKALISTTSPSSSSSGLCSSRRILKRSRMVRRRVVKKKTKKIGSRKVTANCIAKRLVKKRTRMLKSLLPGGESMEDDVVLIEETLDYIQSLRAQVEVMRCLANASEIIRNS